MEYIVVVEDEPDGSLSACVPNLPGCENCCDGVEEVRTLIAEAVAAHVESLCQHGETVPPPSTRTFSVRAA